MELIFFYFHCLRRALKVEETTILYVEFHRFNFGKYRNTTNAKKHNIAHLLICKGEKIANAGNLGKKIADFCESYNLYQVEWVGLITPGYPRASQDTPGRVKFLNLIHLFIHSDENKAKTASNSFHFKCIASKRSY